MANSEQDIHDYQVPNLVNKLVRFFGRTTVEKCLRKYEDSLKSAGPVFREYYLKTRHPWWNAFVTYFELEKAGKSIRKNLTEEIEKLVADAKKISLLRKQMPESVLKKYKKDLLDKNRAYDYLFEIEIAWHFYLRGAIIEWHEDRGKGHAEFLVRTPDFEFDVECKRISVDSSRKIRRRDFYRFAEKLLSEVQKRNYTGTIDIIIKDRLHSSSKFINELVTEVIDVIVSGHTGGKYPIHHGHVSLNLTTAIGTPVDFEARWPELWKRKSHQGHGAIFANERDDRPIDAVEITLRSEKADTVLEGIQDRISIAAKHQLDKSRPGLISCFLEGVNDLGELADESALQIMSYRLLAKPELAHVAAISYCSETILKSYYNTKTYNNQGLIFRNPSCRFEEAKVYQFLS